MKCAACFIRAALRWIPASQSTELSKLLQLRAPAYLRWVSAEALPAGGQTHNANDAVLEPSHLAVSGLLIFAAQCDPTSLFRTWNLLLGSEGTGTFGKDPHVRYSSLFEACLFLPAPSATCKENTFELWFCPDQGRLLSRSSFFWVNAVTVSFSCGSFAGFHDHSDRNSFTSFTQGQWLVIDPGADDGRGARSACQSIARDTILIDGRGQALSGEGHGDDGEIISFETCQLWDGLVGDAAKAYRKGEYNPVAFVLHHFLFVKSPFPCVAMWDECRMADDINHNWEYLLHTLSQLHSFEAREHVRSLDSCQGREAPDCLCRSGRPRGVTYRHEDFGTSHVGVGAHSLHRFHIRSVEPDFVTLLQTTMAGQARMIVAVPRQ